MTLRNKWLGILLSVMLCVPVIAISDSTNGGDTPLEVTWFQENNTTLQVAIPAAEGELVTVNVLYEGKVLADVLPDTVKETHVYQDLAEADASGKVTFHIGILEGGDYTMYYRVGTAPLRSMPLTIVNLDEQIGIMMDVLNAAESTADDKAAAVHAFYTEEAIVKALGISKGDFAVSDAEVEGYILTYLLENEDAEDMVSFVREAYNTGVLLAALNDGEVENLFEQTDYIDFEKTDIAEWYDKTCVTEKVQKAVTAKVAAAEPASKSELMTVLTEAFILSVVKDPDGVGNAKDLMDDFKDLIGITPTNNLAPYRAVIERDYDDLDALKDAFDTAKEDEEDDDDSSSGGESSGGGGSRGSSGGSSSVRFEQAILPQTSAVSIPMEIYSDLSDAAWASEYIITLSEKNIVSGKGDGKFYPNDNITREEFTKMIVETFISSAEEAEISFSDVSADTWYYEYAAKAYGAGIVTGYDDGRFGVGDLITREDMAVIAFRASKREVQGGELYFNDSDAISDYALEAVTELSSLGIITGYDDNFEPKAPATRAQAAKIICLLMQL